MLSSSLETPPQSHEEVCFTNLLDISQLSQVDKMVKADPKDKMALGKDLTEVMLQQARQRTKRASKTGVTCAKILR